MNPFSNEHFNKAIEETQNAMDAGDYMLAMQNANMALSYDSENVLALLYRAAAFFGLGSYIDTKSDCLQVLAQEPGNPQALFYIAQSDMYLGAFEEAVAFFQEILNVDPTNSFQLKDKVEAGLKLALRKMKKIGE